MTIYKYINIYNLYRENYEREENEYGQIPQMSIPLRELYCHVDITVP